MEKYTPRPQDMERIENDFKYHKPNDVNQTNRYGFVRFGCHSLARHLLTICPPSRELSLALTNLEQVMFWANAAIARNEKPEESTNAAE